MTPDIVKLRETLPTLEPIIDRLELTLVDDPSWNEPSDTSYLSDADRQNPDIAANVEAMAETNKLIAWFGKDAEGYLGLWRGPKNRTLAEAPVVRLDTEGQYSIIAATVPEYLAIAMPEDEFADTRDALTKAGFKVSFNPDAIWGALDEFDDDPNAYRAELYERYRVARGLPRTDEEEEEGDGGGDDIETSEMSARGDEGDDADEREFAHDADAVPEPSDFAAGTMPAIPTARADEDDDDIDDDDDDGAGDYIDTGDTGEDDDDDDDEEPPPLAAAPVKQAVKQPAAKAAAKKPAAKAAAKKPAAKAAAKKPAKKAAAKPAAKKAAAKPGAKKAAAKPAAKKAAKPAAKKAAKPAAKKRK